MRLIRPSRSEPSRGLRRSWLAILLGSTALLGSSSASAVSFGATAAASVAGNCQSEISSQSTGGSLAASAVASAARSGAINPPACFGLYTGIWSGSASSFVSLSTGQIRLFASGQGPEATSSLFPAGSPVNLVVGANAQFFDYFSLVAPAGYVGTDALIEVHLDVTRTVVIAPGSDGLRNEAFLSWALTTGGSRTNRCDDDGSLTPRAGCSGGPIVHQFRLALGTPLFIQVDMNAVTRNNATADASATGTLSLVLPAGFTISSDSGVLLVPEPASAVLLGIALLGLGALARARRVRPR